MTPFGEAINFLVASAPKQPGVHSNLLYILFNLFIPICLGLILTGITKLIEKGLTNLLGAKR